MKDQKGFDRKSALVALHCQTATVSSGIWMTRLVNVNSHNYRKDIHEIWTASSKDEESAEAAEMMRLYVHIMTVGAFRDREQLGNLYDGLSHKLYEKPSPSQSNQVYHAAVFGLLEALQTLGHRVLDPEGNGTILAEGIAHFASALASRDINKLSFLRSQGEGERARQAIASFGGKIQPIIESLLASVAEERRTALIIFVRSMIGFFCTHLMGPEYRHVPTIAEEGIGYTFMRQVEFSLFKYLNDLERAKLFTGEA